MKIEIYKVTETVTAINNNLSEFNFFTPIITTSKEFVDASHEFTEIDRNECSRAFMDAYKWSHDRLETLNDYNYIPRINLRNIGDTSTFYQRYIDNEPF